MRRSLCLFEEGAREYFPIKKRIQDRRLVRGIAEQVEVTTRYRNVTETFMDSGAARQTEPPPWSKKTRPTHFVSLRIPPRCSFQSSFATMLQEITFANEPYTPLFVKPERLHVTCGVFTAKTDDDVAALVAAAKTGAEGLPRLQMRFEGIGTFNSGRVLFAKVVADRSHFALTEAVQRIRAAAAAAGVDTKGNPLDSYVPHATIAKVRPHQQEQFPSRVIPLAVWAPFKHEAFGPVAFSALDVCAMSGTDADGYYKTVASFPLQ